MSNYSKYNMVYLLQKWMDSVAGQTFMNYAYSWGAAVVILGTLFKLTHLPGANLMLFIGMGTEVVVFFISAFDRPFDKTTDGMELEHDNMSYEEKKVLLERKHNECSERYKQAQQMSINLPNNKESEEILSSLHEIYEGQLSKAKAQFKTMENIDLQLAAMSKNLENLNMVYNRMVDAIRIKPKEQ